MSTLFRLCLAAALCGGVARSAEEPSALRECTALGASRIEVGPCLDKKLAEAEAELSAAAQEVGERMMALDRVTGRPLAASAFEESERAFNAFRKRNCAWLSAQVGAGTGAGNVERDCAIEMTRARTLELHKWLPSAWRGAPAGTAAGSGPPGLVGPEWRLTRLVVGGKEIAILPGSAPTLRFDGKGTAQGNATLNRYARGCEVLPSGTLRWSGPGIATTRMAGPPELMDQEDRFLAALDRAVRLRLEGNTLVLEDGPQTTVLAFARADGPSAR